MGQRLLRYRNSNCGISHLVRVVWDSPRFRWLLLFAWPGGPLRRGAGTVTLRALPWHRLLNHREGLRWHHERWHACALTLPLRLLRQVESHELLNLLLHFVFPKVLATLMYQMADPPRCHRLQYFMLFRL